MEREWECQVSVRTGCTVQRQGCNGPQWLLAVALLNNVKPNMHQQMDQDLFAIDLFHNYVTISRTLLRLAKETMHTCVR